VSTKIYVAYKLKDGSDLWTMLRRLRDRSIEEIKKVLINIYKSLIESVDENSKDYKENLKDWKKDDPWMAKFLTAHDTFRKLKRDVFEKDEFMAIVWIHELDGKFYLIPNWQGYGGYFGKIFNFMKRDKDLEDFSYWDNTDKPSRIRVKEWEARGKIWDRIFDDDGGFGVELRLCDYYTFYKVDPWIEFSRDQRLRRSKKAEKKK
jgi:hypothetical protein